MIFSGGFSSVACLGAALRMWFNRKSARRKRTGIGMRDSPAFQIKKPPRTDHRRQRLEKGRRRRRRPGNMSPPDLPPRRCDALALGALDRFGILFPGDFEREASRHKILNEWSPVGE